MIKIRSTEKLASSNRHGLCDMVRTLSVFNYNLAEHKVVTAVKDELFQEKVNSDGLTERIIREKREERTYGYTRAQINSFFQQHGIALDKSKDFLEGIDENLLIVLTAQTAAAQRQGMTNWVADTEHIIVEEFSS